MRFRAFVLSLLHFCAKASRAAYIESRACLDHDAVPDSRHGGSFGLRASLAASPELHGLDRLELTFIGDPTSPVACEQAQRLNATSSLRISSLGSSSTFAGRLVSSDCAEMYSPLKPIPKSQSVRFEFAYDVAPARFLDTYWLTAELQDENGTMSCLNAYLTPDVGAAVSQSAIWVPVAIFAIVLLAGIWTEVRNLASSAGRESGRADQCGPERRRSHIVRIGDCISYLQFIFFAGSLTLNEPGFLRPVVSKMSWSTLMLPAGLVAHKSHYSGVHDGIYEVNGTMSEGTKGLELATQVIGGTVTVNTWLNIITLGALIFFLILGLMILERRLTRAHYLAPENKTSSAYGSQDDSTIHAAALATLRLFCSYLLFPLVAWSTYILTYAKGIPMYYTVAAVIMVICLATLVCFAMWRGSPHRMGYLLVESIHKKPQSTSLQSRMQDVYATSVFVLLFLRGAAIGGLQMAGLVQLLVLLMTEAIQLAFFAFSYRQNPLTSQTGRMPVPRTMALLLEVGFVPGLEAELSVRIILGFAVLFVHTCVLLSLFLLPAIRDIYILSTRSSTASASSYTQDDGGSNNTDPGLTPVSIVPFNPIFFLRFGFPFYKYTNYVKAMLTTMMTTTQVYNLRQIMMRPTRDLTPERHLTTPSVTLMQDPTSSLSSTSSSSSRTSYFRSPRHNMSTNFLSRTSSSDPSTRLTRTNSSALVLSPTRSRVANRPATTSEDIFIPLPNNPSVDYSFREADLYYHQPRTKTFGEDKAAEGQGSGQGQTLKESLRRMTATFSSRK
ncbi:hypothetical protein E4U30_005495 [Claviceps sp. LM220 group G6]|nr:hypothetical protein E4U15_001147 [Claviceps sp. LM218 group G6]KAG6092382.1 hypothetical protein E4U30_005495 [Claviceps sp. LM220 group G6]KAG6103353.1 hypothetical protein E4U31_002894 [Claviceps sp. LM219 group G6]